jgi:hypothetical protein
VPTSAGSTRIFSSAPLAPIAHLSATDFERAPPRFGLLDAAQGVPLLSGGSGGLTPALIRRPQSIVVTRIPA